MAAAVLTLTNDDKSVLHKIWTLTTSPDSGVLARGTEDTSIAGALGLPLAAVRSSVQFLKEDYLASFVRTSRDPDALECVQVTDAGQVEAAQLSDGFDAAVDAVRGELVADAPTRMSGDIARAADLDPRVVVAALLLLESREYVRLSRMGDHLFVQHVSEHLRRMP